MNFKQTMRNIFYAHWSKKYLSIVLISLCIVPSTATARSHQGFSLPSSLSKKDLTPRRNATFSKFGFKIFEAKLWTDKKNTTQKPLALQIKYARTIKAKHIVESSIKEMSKQKVPQSRLKLWNTHLKRTIPNVKKGDVLTGYRDTKTTSFYLNKKFIGTVHGAKFGNDFFGIWLKSNTSEPKLRKKILQK